VTEFASPALSAWQSFYVIVGSSAAALIGIQFVVITLIANMRLPATAESIGAFGTPTVVYFASALLVSAIMSVPWPSLLPTSMALALCGFAGLAYGAIVIRRARSQTYYQPDWEDWFWYALLPCSVYAALALAAVFFRTTTQLAEFVIGAATLGLLFIGIHNAWDSVTHILVASSHDDATRTE
jgi:hypothetical protein